MKLITWFDHRPLGPLVPDPCLILGSTGLIVEFISRVASADTRGELAIAVPFIAPNLISRLSGLAGLVRNSTNCTIVIGNSRRSHEACEQLIHLGWASLEICQAHALHAKKYAFLGASGFATALFGSHNLTISGTSRNREAGVLLISQQHSEVSSAVACCIDEIKSIGRAGRKIYDSSAWPEGSLLWGKDNEYTTSTRAIVS